MGRVMMLWTVKTHHAFDLPWLLTYSFFTVTNVHNYTFSLICCFFQTRCKNIFHPHESVLINFHRPHSVSDRNLFFSVTSFGVITSQFPKISFSVVSMMTEGQIERKKLSLHVLLFALTRERKALFLKLSTFIEWRRWSVTFDIGSNATRSKVEVSGLLYCHHLI